MGQTEFIALPRVENFFHAEAQSRRGFSRGDAETRRRNNGAQSAPNLLRIHEDLDCAALRGSAAPRETPFLCGSAPLRESYSRLPRARRIGCRDGAEHVVETARFGVEFLDVPALGQR